MSQRYEVHDATGVIVDYPGVGIMYVTGTSVPTGAGYAPGCIFVNTSGGSATFAYINEGTSSSASFVAMASTSGNNATWSGTNTFSGTVSFTGARVDGSLINGPTSANGMASFVYTLKASRDAGKTILFTSGGAASRHKRIVLPFASTMTGGASGAVFVIMNGHKLLNSNGLTIVTSAATGRKLDGSSRQLKSTSRLSPSGASRWGGSITLKKINNTWYTLHRDFGPTMSAAANRASNTWIRL